MNFPRIIAKVYNEPWLITPEVHAAIRESLEIALAGSSKLESIGSIGEPEPDYPESDSIAFIPIHGIIGKHLSLMETACGGCDLSQVEQATKLAASSRDITRIVFDMRTPGGTDTGVPELGDLISQVSRQKDTSAFIDSQCCSAGYWLAAQANGIFATPSSKVGSIGVYSYVLDASKAIADKGVKVESFQSGKFKLTGAPWKPLTDEERSMIQSRVDALGVQFRESVNLKRSISQDSMEGQVFNGRDGYTRGLVDQVVSGLDEFLDLISD